MAATAMKAETDLEVLQRLNHDYVQSVARSDVAWFDRHLSKDFLNSNSDGTLSDRAEFLSRIAAPIQVAEFECDDVRVRIFGDIAIVHGRTTYRKAGGQAAAGRYTDVWARREGRWLCISAHVTRG